MSLPEEIAELQATFFAALDRVKSSGDVEALKVEFLGKKGRVTALTHRLKDLDAGERPAAGQCINDCKRAVEEALEEACSAFMLQEEGAKLKSEKLDVTLPGRKHSFRGRKHIITQVMEEMLDILMEMGFSVQYGPDIDTDYYNFEALNMGPDHPARAMQDTFYITPQVLLRTHTSNVQARIMESHPPPLRIATPGTCFRNEDVTARSHVFFHQIEVLYVDKGVTFGDLLTTAEIFLQKFYSPTIEMRIRPSYFPFVEPGMEIDIRCLPCGGKGCSLCKHSGWLEVGGAGMVHPEVLTAGGIDPKEYSGFAWGFGIERPALRKYDIPDIRLFFENDLRFLSQF